MNVIWDFLVAINNLLDPIYSVGSFIISTVTLGFSCRINKKVSISVESERLDLKKKSILDNLENYRESLTNSLDIDIPLKKSFFANLNSFVTRITSEYPIHAKEKSFSKVVLSLENNLKTRDTNELIKDLQKLIVEIEKA